MKRIGTTYTPKEPSIHEIFDSEAQSCYYPSEVGHGKRNGDAIHILLAVSVDRTVIFVHIEKLKSVHYWRFFLLLGYDIFFLKLLWSLKWSGAFIVIPLNL